MNTCSDATCENMLNTQYYQQVQECDRRIHATCESKMKKKTTSRIRIGAQRGFRFTVEPPDGTLRWCVSCIQSQRLQTWVGAGLFGKRALQAVNGGRVRCRTYCTDCIHSRVFFSATHPKTRSWLRRVVVRSGMTRFFLTVCGLTQTFNTSRAVYRFFAQNSSNVFETRPSNGNNQRLNDGFGSSFASPSWMSVRDSVTLPFEQTVGPFRWVEWWFKSFWEKWLTFRGLNDASRTSSQKSRPALVCSAFRWFRRTEIRKSIWNWSIQSGSSLDECKKF